MCIKRNRAAQKGLSLIELILFMLIISIALVGITQIVNLTTVASADPLREKQALAIAESLLEEIELQAFTFCDPDDPKAGTAQVAAVAPNGCTDAASVQVAAPTNSGGIETRNGVVRFDNVGDYNGYTMPNALDINGNAVDAALNNYATSVAIDFPAPGDFMRINVRVTSGATDVLLTGYRYRYAPRSIP
ncbi:MAG: type II secretion system protein [Burkholderiales bacterium]|nr:type II secretion system protein [Burkholderiales bacterium]